MDTRHIAQLPLKSPPQINESKPNMKKSAHIGRRIFHTAKGKVRKVGIDLGMWEIICNFAYVNDRWLMYA